MNLVAESTLFIFKKPSRLCVSTKVLSCKDVFLWSVVYYGLVVSVVENQNMLF